MKFLAKHIKEFAADEQGATAVEYGLLVAAIAAVIVAIVVSLGGQINGAFKKVSDGLAPVAPIPQ